MTHVVYAFKKSPQSGKSQFVGLCLVAEFAAYYYCHRRGALVYYPPQPASTVVNGGSQFCHAQADGGLILPSCGNNSELHNSQVEDPQKTRGFCKYFSKHIYILVWRCIGTVWWCIFVYAICMYLCLLLRLSDVYPLILNSHTLILSSLACFPPQHFSHSFSYPVIPHFHLWCLFVHGLHSSFEQYSLQSFISL